MSSVKRGTDECYPACVTRCGKASSSLAWTATPSRRDSWPEREGAEQKAGRQAEDREEVRLSWLRSTHLHNRSHCYMDRNNCYLCDVAVKYLIKIRHKGRQSCRCCSGDVLEGGHLAARMILT